MKKAKRKSRLTRAQIDDLKRELFLTDEDCQIETMSIKQLNQLYCDLTYLEYLHKEHNLALDMRNFTRAFELVSKIETELSEFNAWTESLIA